MKYYRWYWLDSLRELRSEKYKWRPTTNSTTGEPWMLRYLETTRINNYSSKWYVCTEQSTCCIEACKISTSTLFPISGSAFLSCKNRLLGQIRYVWSVHCYTVIPGTTSITTRWRCCWCRLISMTIFSFLSFCGSAVWDGCSQRMRHAEWRLGHPLIFVMARDGAGGGDTNQSACWIKNHTAPH